MIAKRLSQQPPARRLILASACLALLPLPAPAETLSLSLPPGAAQTGSDQLPSGVQLPIGVSRDGEVPRADFAGTVLRSAYQVEGTTDTLTLTAPLRQQLEAAGWSILVDCATAACGGFDFRFALSVMPEPAMHVDLGDFRYLAANKDAEILSILASKRGSVGYVQTVLASPAAARGEDLGGDAASGGTPADPDAEPPSPETSSPGVVITPSAPGTETEVTAPGQMAAALDTSGRVVLSDLDFATGSSELGPGPYASLEELASYLQAHPNRKLALVGHTDATGGLDINISVSRNRARSVLETLVRQHKIPRSQLSAEGVGFLSPLRSNLGDEGRSLNRRVEAVLLALD